MRRTFDGDAILLGVHHIRNYNIMAWGVSFRDFLTHPTVPINGVHGELVYKVPPLLLATTAWNMDSDTMLSMIFHFSNYSSYLRSELDSNQRSNLIFYVVHFIYV